MWIRKEEYRDLKSRIANLKIGLLTETSKRESLERELAVTHNNEDWLRVQTNVANARADAMFTQYTSARLPTPMIEKPSAAQNNIDEQIELTKGGALPALEDPGDDLAQRLGIEHDENGGLVYRS